MNRSLFLSSLLFLALLPACIEDQEGCLDLDAVNFDVEADIDCIEPCCTYPALQLAVRHRVVSADFPDSLQRFRYDSIYLLGNDAAPISFDVFRFYVQNVALLLSDGSALQVADRLEVFSPTAGALTLIDDVALIDQAEFGNRRLGSLLPGGTVTGVAFEVSLPEAWQLIAPGEFPEGHPLRVGPSELLFDTLDGYSGLATVFRIPPTTADSTVVRFLGEIPVSLALDTPVPLRRGFDVTISLQLNYERLFESTAIATATDGTLFSAIVDRLPNCFELLDVFQE